MHYRLTRLLISLILECPHTGLFLESLVISLLSLNIAIKKLNYYFQATKEMRLIQMNEFEELRNEAYDNAKIYKDKTKKLHEQKILRKEFKIRELVLPYNSRLRLFLVKLKSRWSGPYTVVTTTPFGAMTLKTNSRNLSIILEES